MHGDIAVIMRHHLKLFIITLILSNMGQSCIAPKATSKEHRSSTARS